MPVINGFSSFEPTSYRIFMATRGVDLSSCTITLSPLSRLNLLKFIIAGKFYLKTNLIKNKRRFVIVFIFAPYVQMQVFWKIPLKFSI
jgi:hypothetical protein